MSYIISIYQELVHDRFLHQHQLLSTTYTKNGRTYLRRQHFPQKSMEDHSSNMTSVVAFW